MTREEQVKKATTIIGDELKLAYSLSFAIDILFHDIAARISSLGGFKFEKKRNLSIFTQKVRETCLWYERCGFDEDFEAATDGDYLKLDGYRQDANELIRFVMLYIDRTTTYEAYNKVVEFLTNLPEGGLFNKAEIERFNFVAKCRKQ